MTTIFRTLNLCTLDGTQTKRLNLLERKTGFHVVEWGPAVADLKGGGVFQTGIFTDGRRLVMNNMENVTEEFTLHVNNQNADALILATRLLRVMLQKVRNYWVSHWMSEPVWLEARFSNESMPRYALIYNAIAPADSDPYNGSFASESPAFSEIKLTIERGHWSSAIPGTGEDTAIGTMRWSNGTGPITRYFGNIDSADAIEQVTDGSSFVANQFVINNLTHVYFDGPSGPGSGNLLDYSVPYAMFTATGAATGDELIFSQDLAVAANQCGPFNNLVFDIEIAQTGLTIVWQYYKGGATWSNLTVVDNTDSFQNTGVRTVHWIPPSDWVSVVLPWAGTTGYAVRAYVSNAAIGNTVPAQQHRRIYSVQWNYTDIKAEDTGGDIPALARWIIDDLSGNGTTVKLQAHRVIMGLRSTDRGENFRTNLNLSDVGNDYAFPAQITCYATGGVSVFNTDILAPTGKCLYKASPAVAIYNMGYVKIEDGYAKEWRGEFRIFVRAKQSGGSIGDMGIKIGLIDGDNTTGFDWITDYVIIPQKDTIQLLDLGTIRIGDVDYADEIPNLLEFVIYCQVYNDTGMPSISIYDIILMPTDEWFIDCIDGKLGPPPA